MAPGFGWEDSGTLEAVNEHGRQTRKGVPMGRPNTGPTRRIIPIGYQVWELVMEGASPLLMNSAEYDRRGDTYRAFRQLGSKRGKSLEDEDRLAELEFHLALHYDAEIGVFVPAQNVKELLRSAATKYRKGEEIRRSLIVPDYRIPLIYDGPKEPQLLFDQGFYDQRLVANAGAGSGRVPRTRPCFEQWTVKCEIAFDPEDLDADLIQTVVNRSTKYGFGDGRTIGFGAFSPTLTFRRVERPPSRADAAKPANGHDAKAHAAAVSRITQPDNNGEPEPEKSKRKPAAAAA